VFAVPGSLALVVVVEVEDTDPLGLLE